MCSWVLSDHRIAARNCLLTTCAAKWATIQVGTGRTVLEVAKELNWNAIASMTLLPPTEKHWPKLTRNASIAPAQLGSTRGVSSSSQLTTPATQLPSPTLSTTRSSTSAQPQLRGRSSLSQRSERRLQESHHLGAFDMSNVYAAVYSAILPRTAQVVDPFYLIPLANRVLDPVRQRVQNEQNRHRGRRETRCTEFVEACWWERRSSTNAPALVLVHCSLSVTPTPRWLWPTG